LPHVPWQRFLEAQERTLARGDLSVNSAWPEPLADALRAQYGAKAAELDEALAQEPPQTLRANTLKCSRQNLLARLIKHGLKARASALAPAGIVIEEHADVFSLREFKDGWFELQDEASQLVAELLGPAKPDLWVDYCAGAGGKTLAMAAMLANRGQIIACDTSRRRVQELTRRVKRAGAGNVQSVEFRDDADALAVYHGKAARVLVDGPCSGTGALRRKPDIRLRFSGDELTRFPRMQLEILEAATKLCAPGGRLVYATCSVLREENEDVVEKFLARGGFELEPVSGILPEELFSRVATPDGRFMQCLPHIHNTDGFFAAALKKK
ncbi:MAG TPA: RsmB/NOP family class I SAM-dependent RNA methyltransferase, partial [Planctomycetota bacterium]|nr:RsmB/NOP family class I SAM-dependent RNA methyltransferase [Planctomycetota bacterium]